MTGRLFGGLESDLGAVLSGVGLALQQPLVLKAPQIPQRSAVLVLETVAVLNHVPAGRALELLPTLTAQRQDIGHGVVELVLRLLSVKGFQLLRGVTLQGPAAGVMVSRPCNT